jgi:hypothetical protein
MKRNEMASAYLNQYEDTDIIVSDVSEFDGGAVFDLSDGTHWFSDDNDTYQVSESLTDVEIGWNDTYGWVIVTEDGITRQIGWL